MYNTFFVLHSIDITIIIISNLMGSAPHVGIMGMGMGLCVATCLCNCLVGLLNCLNNRNGTLCCKISMYFRNETLCCRLE
jgi:hypothetical protein